LFVDDDQLVTLKDIGNSAAIQKWAKKLRAKPLIMELASQFRCNGSDGYLAWIDNTLAIRPTVNEKLGRDEFDFRVIDTPTELHALIAEKNKANNKARVVAGYCWSWASKKKPIDFDIVIPEFGYEKRWNLGSDGSLWIVAPTSIDEVGCIHTSQGLELDYVGVIVGPDMLVRDGVIVTQPEQRARSDKSLSGYKKLFALNAVAARQRADQIIKNTYRTLMTRGIKGCYIFCTDGETAEYFKSRLVKSSATQVEKIIASVPSARFSKPMVNNVLPFKKPPKQGIANRVNTVPRIDLKFAAGAFSDNQNFDTTNSDVFELPEWIKPQAGLFVAQVVGESMNRRIPNGSWCLFRSFPVGSRAGKVVVAEHRSIHDSELGGAYTIKVYSSKKVTDSDGNWKHVEIQLKPDSTDDRFKPITIFSADENELRVVAEFLTVL
jgi:uncharacterized protein